MVYLTYEQYVNIGGALDSAAFNRHIVHACRVVDNETHNRVASMESVPESVQYCVRDLVDYFATANTAKANVASRSQSAGSVSESESYKSFDDMYGDICNILYDYLLSEIDATGKTILYRGSGK